MRVADISFKLSAQTAKARFDALKTAKRAFYAGRAAVGVAPASGATAAGTDVPLAVEYSNKALRRFVGRIDKRLSRAAIDARLKITTRRVRITHSRRGRDIDAKALGDQIAASLVDPRLPRVFRPALVTRQAERDRRQAARHGHHDRPVDLQTAPVQEAQARQDL